jgi:hypothetical protein
MELKDFVRTTLVQVVQGVTEAQEAVSHTGALINSKTAAFQPRAVQFDVAVTAREEGDVKTGIGISVVGLIKGGAEGEYGKENTAVSRVRFEVPLRLPVHKAEHDAARTDRLR